MMGDNYYRRGSYQATEGKEFGYDASVILSFFKKIHDHVLNVNAALNMQDLSKEEYTVKVEGFPDENLDYIVFGASYPKSSTPTGKDEISRLIGWVGNMNYSFKDAICWIYLYVQMHRLNSVRIRVGRLSVR